MLKENIEKMHYLSSFRRNFGLFIVLKKKYKNTCTCFYMYINLKKNVLVSQLHVGTKFTNLLKSAFILVLGL